MKLELPHDVIINSCYTYIFIGYLYMFWKRYSWHKKSTNQTLGHAKKLRKESVFCLLAQFYQYDILQCLGLSGEFWHFCTEFASKLKQVDRSLIAVPINPYDLERCPAGPWQLHPEASDFIDYFEKCVYINTNSCEHRDTFRVSMITHVATQGGWIGHYWKEVNNHKVAKRASWGENA